MRSSLRAFWAVPLSLVGLGLVVYLTYLHLALLQGELAGGAACGSSGTMFNCHAVIATPQGTFFNIPLSLWGLIGYLACFSLAFIAWQFPDWTSNALLVLGALGLLFLGIDFVLFMIMITQIRYLCALCLASYAVNLALVLCAKWALARPWKELLPRIPSALMAFLPRPRVAVIWIFWGIVLTGAMGVVAVHASSEFLSPASGKRMRDSIGAYVKHQTRISVDTTQDPLLGRPDQTIQIVEFSDFLCPACQQASRFNTIVFAGHRRGVAFIFKHYPLDLECNPTISQTIHPSACQLAAASECAHEQGKFWGFHDFLFEQGSRYNVAQLERDAERLGLDLEAFRACLSSGRGLEAVKRDITEATRLEVDSTPTYFVDGVRMAGSLPPTVFEELLRALRRRE